MGITNINNVPRMDGVNSVALANASPMNSLSVTKVSMSNFDAAVASCEGLSYAQVQRMNSKGISSTDTSCAWIQFSQNGQGISVLGTNDTPIGPMPAGVTEGSKYFPPLLTTVSMASNWTNATSCHASSSGYVCMKERFINPMPSSQFSSVDDAFATPFLDKLPPPPTAPLARDFYLQTDTNVGTMAATLYEESQKGLSDPTLETRSSYSIFTKSMAPVQPDKESWEASFKAAPPTEYPRPSRDVPVVYGNLEEHDFCAEVNEQTIINENNISCLQKEWLRKGGSVNDYNYPTTRLYGTCYGRVRKN